jgi:hypothetical protein
MWSAPGGWGHHYPIQQSAYANIPSEEGEAVLLNDFYDFERIVKNVVYVTTCVNAALLLGLVRT